MDFDELKKSWQSQNVDIPEGPSAGNAKLMSEWQKQQRGVLWSNIGTTAGFVGVLIVFGWVYKSFHEGRSIFFTGSLVFISVLLLVYLWVIWKGIANKKNDPTLSSKEFIEHSIEKLKWRRKTITTYTTAYSILLWAALMLYLLDVTRGSRLVWQIVEAACTTLYIFGMRFFVVKNKQKKQLLQIDQLISDMKLLKSKLEE